MSSTGSARSQKTIPDPLLADLVERVTSRLQAGDDLDLEAVLTEHPEHADEIRRLFPALAMLGELRSSALSESQSRRSTRFEPPILDGVLGDYRIIREIGRGGMGVVYEAEQLSLSRRVALKVLPFAPILDPRHLQRFQNEARAAASLHHPHIVPVYAVGSERGVHYYAMQFIEGKSLAELIAAQRSANPGRRPLEGGAETTDYDISPRREDPSRTGAGHPSGCGHVHRSRTARCGELPSLRPMGHPGSRGAGACAHPRHCASRHQAGQPDRGRPGEVVDHRLRSGPDDDRCRPDHERRS